MSAPASAPPAPSAAVFAVAVLAIAIYAAMDAVMKGLTLAMGVYVALLWRTGATIVLTGGVLAFDSPRWPPRTTMRLHLKRSAVTVVMALLFFWGLARVPMAQAVALTHIAPLLALFLAAMLLGERIAPRAILASLIAACGVGIILIGQAQAEMGPEAFAGALALLGSAVCYSYNIILMRQQAQVARPAEIAFVQSVLVTAMLALAYPWFGSVPSVDQVPAILLGALFATASLLLLSWAYARGEASYLAPSEYTAFLWASLFGWLIFGEVASLFTVAGAALIVGACIWAARAKAPVPDSEAALV